MVLLWKKPNSLNKGIIIFTHKEIKNSFIPFGQLKNKYLIGLHIGCWFKKTNIIPNYVDFILASPNQLENKFITTPVIPFNSRNFLPQYFDPKLNKNKKTLIESLKLFNHHSRIKITNDIYTDINNLNKDKYWDIITIAKPHHVKKLDIFLQQTKKVLQEMPSVKILIISAIAPNEREYKNDHHDLEKLISNIFSNKQKNNITLLRPDCGTNEGIDNIHIFPFYQWSKIFCFFSEVEGESRVVHEALCCGLPIVCYKHLKGGANEYLNETNSLQFTNYEDAYLSIIQCLQNYINLNQNLNDIHKILREDKSIDTFKNELKKIYLQQNTVFDNELIKYDQLHFRLPSHYYYDEWANFSDNETSDIINKNQWDIFINCKKVEI